MTTKTLQSLLIGALLSASTAFAGNGIEISTVEGTQQAKFSLGDAKCVLVDEAIRCTPIVVAAK
jgi:hypothetical protein